MSEDHRFTLATIEAAFRHFALIADGLRDVDVERAREHAVSHGTGPLNLDLRRLYLYIETKNRIDDLFPEGWSQPRGKD